MGSKRMMPMILRGAFATVLSASLIALPTQAFAVTSAEKQAEADQAYAQLNDMQGVLDQKSDEYYDALAESAAAETAMEDAQAREDQANAQIAELQSHLSERARSMYKSGPTSLIDVMLGSASFDDFVSTWSFLQDLNADDAACIEQTKQLESEAEAARNEYSEQKDLADQKVAEAEQAKADAEQTIESLQALTASLDTEVAQLVAQEQAAAAAAATTQTTTAADGTTTTVAADGTTTATTTDDAATDDSSASSGDSGGVYEGGSDAVSRAYSCLGAPYIWGDAGPDGYDCSGLVSYCITGTHSHVFTSSGLNGYAAVSDPQPGDVCVRDGHCGIYIGDGQYINASDYGVGVIISSVPDDMKIVRP